MNGNTALPKRPSRTRILAFVSAIGAALLPAQQATMAVRGVVVDVRGFGVPVAEVWVGEHSDLRGDVVLARTFADGEGVFLLPRVPSRHGLRLHVRVEGMVSERLRLRLQPEKPIWRIVLRETLPVRGTLRDSRGNPVRDALVWTPGQEPRCEATTDQHGAFELAAVGIGRSTLHAWVPGEGGVEASVQVGTGGEDAALVSGQDKTSEVRVLVDGYPETAPAPIEILLDERFAFPPPLPGGRNPTTRWQWGNDLVRGAAPTVEPRAEGFVFVRQPGTRADAFMHRSLFRAYPRGEVPTVRYRVRVRSENGHAVRDAAFELSAPGDRDPLRAVSDDDGIVTFDSPLLPGDTAELRSADPRWVVEYPWDQAAPVPATTVDTTMHVWKLTPDEQPEIKVLGSNRVSGRLLRADGQPARFEQMWLGYVAREIDEVRWQLRTTVTDATGAFAFAALPPYREQLIVGTTGATSERFWLRESSTRRELGELRMRPPTSVEGTVRDVDGKPAVGISLLLVSGDEQHPALTDLQGRYRVGDIAPGTVRLSSTRWPDGPTALCAPVTVEAGSTTTIDGQR